MSGGGDSSQTTSVEIPDEFKTTVFGAPKARIIDGKIVARDPEEFNGILPEAEKLYEGGQLAPTPAFGDISQQGEQANLDLAAMLQSSFLPQVQDVFNTGFTDRSAEIADFATMQMQEDMARSVMPSISSAAIQAGQQGSSRQGIAEGLAQAEAAKNISGVRAGIMNEGEKLKQDAAARQLAFAPQLMQMLGMPAGLISQVGAGQDARTDAEAGSDFENLLRLSQLVQGFIPGANQTTITPTSGPSRLASVGGGALSGAATGATIGAAEGPIGVGGGALIGGLLGLLG